MTEVVADFGAMESYCGQTSSNAAQFDEAVQAAQVGTALSPIAFGILCQFLTPAAVAVQGAVLGAMTITSAAVRAGEGGVRACATSYRETDERIAVGFKGMA
ncbi:hypothetical protein [Occultella gossypii]|uniref:Uncharacterized protein n=1 Tax=Occultella gossypii TaxID=2800820 RepID=A0ABS7S876_9MICO|nr:hypothetical protein [Occultella gossypii]MBZ2196507.1 hypothetical protein [Occultella gossypii]